MTKMSNQDTHGQKGNGWIGVDLDGTLAEYDTWVGPEHIGKPIPKMVARIKAWLSEGTEVRIVTARVAPKCSEDATVCRGYIETWLLEHLEVLLPITHSKDEHMWELWDDRAVQVEKNTGISMEEKLEELRLKNESVRQDVKKVLLHGIDILVEGTSKFRDGRD